MRLASLLLILSVWMLGSCRNDGEKTASDDGQKQEAAIPTGDFYRRLSGTIAGKGVTLHLHRAGDWVGGAYSYDAVGIPISLMAWSDSTPGDNTFELTEFSEAGLVDESYAYPTLRLTLTADGAKGVWVSADSTRRYDIALVESYRDNSVRMNVVAFADSARLVEDRATPQASVRFAAVEQPMRGGELPYANGAIRALFGGDGSWRAMFSAAAQYFFTEYRTTNVADTADPSTLESEMYNWSTEQRATVWMNWKDWLIIRDFQASYTGGAHGNHGSRFLNCDRGGDGRTWALHDVVADTSALAPFLHAAALTRWGLPPDAPLHNRLLVDAVPLTDNFYLTSTGLALVYNPYEIASYADGEVHLFIPYKRILLLLTEEFKQRMGLESSAAMRG